MPDKYARKSGDFAATGAGSIWQLQDGTAAAPPLNGEDIRFDRDVTVTSFTSPASAGRSIHVENGVKVRLTASGVIAFAGTTELNVDGTLTIAPTESITFDDFSRCVIHNAGTVDTGGKWITMRRNSELLNEGTMVLGAILYGDNLTASRSRHVPGRLTNMSMFGGARTTKDQVLAIRGHTKCEYLTLQADSAGPYPILFQLESGTIEAGRIRFYSYNSILPYFNIEQNADLIVTGDLVEMQSGWVTWNVDASASSTFAGTADQFITLPAIVTGQTWVVDKPAGVLDLINFDGCLQGRIRKLYIRASSGIDLSGPPPCLRNSMDAWSYYQGLKGDSISEGPPRNLVDHLRESMDLCENYGRIVVPAGKTLCTKSLKNHAGANIQGEGVLCVRHGNLTNNGSIDSSLTIRYFDLPVRAELAAPETACSNLPYTVDIGGSIGGRFQVDWGDGSSTEVAEPGELTHYYAEAFRISPSTPGEEVTGENGIKRKIARVELTLTAWNVEGTANSVSKSIFLESQPVSLNFMATPSSGYVPLIVTVDVDSAAGRLFTYDWGNGQTTGPAESSSERHTYHHEGLYTIRVTAENSEGVTLIASKPLTVLPAAPRPRARLAITPWEGDMPHQVAASVAGSAGSSMSLDWGDGTGAVDVNPDIEVTHLYENAGRFPATLTVLNEQDISVTASQVVNVKDPTAILAVLDVKPSTGIAPLTVLADASESVGNAFTFTWGDGTSTGPQPASAATHTFDRPGYYPAILTVEKGGSTTSVTMGVVVLLAPPYPTEQIVPSPLGPVELDRKTKYHGIPRGNMPFPYRYALAQGESQMKDTLQLFCPMNESGRALENGSALFLGRITHADGRPVSPTEIASASYSVYRLDDSDASVRIPVEGHDDVALDVEEILLEDTMTDENWVFDELGYNFHHVPDDTLFSPFPTAGRNYLVAYTLRPEAAVPKILIQYRVRVV